MDKNKQWVEEMTNKGAQGEELVRQASSEALKKVGKLLPKIQGLEVRQSEINKVAREIGAGLALINKVPEIRDGLKNKKKLRELGLNNKGGEVIANLYLGYLVKELTRPKKEPSTSTTKKGGK